MVDRENCDNFLSAHSFLRWSLRIGKKRSPSALIVIIKLIGNSTLIALIGNRHSTNK